MFFFFFFSLRMAPRHADHEINGGNNASIYKSPNLQNMFDFEERSKHFWPAFKTSIEYTMSISAQISCNSRLTNAVYLPSYSLFAKLITQIDFRTSTL